MKTLIPFLLLCAACFAQSPSVLLFKRPPSAAGGGGALVYPTNYPTVQGWWRASDADPYFTNGQVINNWTSVVNGLVAAKIGGNDVVMKKNAVGTNSAINFTDAAGGTTLLRHPLLTFNVTPVSNSRYTFLVFGKVNLVPAVYPIWSRAANNQQFRISVDGADATNALYTFDNGAGLQGLSLGTALSNGFHIVSITQGASNTRLTWNSATTNSSVNGVPSGGWGFVDMGGTKMEVIEMIAWTNYAMHHTDMMNLITNYFMKAYPNAVTF